MKKMIIRLAALVLPLLVSSSSFGGQQVGDNATIIVPTGLVKNMRQVLVVKSAPKPTASKVGNCGADVRWQDADLVDRASPERPVPAGGGAAAAGGRGASTETLPTVPTQVAILAPGVVGFKDYKVGYHVGSFREAGKCGPGYDIFIAHIIALE